MHNPLNLVPGVDGVVPADGGEELGEEGDQEVVGRHDVHEKVVRNLAYLEIVIWIFTISNLARGL